MLDLLASWSSTAAALLGIVIAFPARKTSATSSDAAAQLPAVEIASSKRPTFLARFKREIPAAEKPLRIPRTALTPAQHFARVAQVIQTAVRTSEIVNDVQAQARIQLEVVEFSIDRIFEEVAEVMTLPATMRPRPAPVSVPARAVRHAA